MYRAILGGTTVLAGLAVLSVLIAQEPRRPAASNEWEYYSASKSSVVREERGIVNGVSTEKLNEFGAEGWQLCETFGEYLVFTRPKLATAARPGGKAEPAPAIRGTVTLDGEPLSGGKITFHLPGSEFVGSKTDKTGKFEVSRVPAEEPLRVTIEGEDVPVRYASEETTSLRIEASRNGDNVFAFELKSE